MIVRCEPLYDGDTRPRCAQFYDDMDRSTICPHKELHPYTSPLAMLEAFALMDGYLTEVGLGSPAR